jgi:outer membrane protein OmpA-like peptidoglycan-associated protein
VVQAENQELRDVALNVRGQNRDLAQRALDDSRRLKAQEEAIARYERVIGDYQDERERMLALIDQIRSQVRTAALAPPTTAMLDGLDTFARGNPDCLLDPPRGGLTIPVASLFQAGTADLSAEGQRRLDDLAAALDGPASDGLALNVAGEGRSPGLGDDAVRLASGSASTPAPPNALALDRARRIRDHLAQRLGLDPSRIAVSSGGQSNLSGDALPRASSPAPPSIAIRVRRIAPEPSSR